MNCGFMSCRNGASLLLKRVALERYFSRLARDPVSRRMFVSASATQMRRRPFFTSSPGASINSGGLHGVRVLYTGGSTLAGSDDLMFLYFFSPCMALGSRPFVFIKIFRFSEESRPVCVVFEEFGGVGKLP